MRITKKLGYTITLATASVVVVGAAYGAASTINIPPGDTVTAECHGERLSMWRVDRTAVGLRCRPSAQPSPTQSTPTPSPTPSPTPTVTPTPTTTRTSPAGSAIRVAGNRLVDRSGAAVTLRGVNVSGTEFTCAQNWTDDPYGGQPLGERATFDAIRAWKANVVRIPLNEDCWLNINGVRVGGGAYQAAIRTEVAMAHAAGLYVILDLHWSAPGAVRADKQQPMADQDHSLDFWRSVAAAYRDDPAVLFDAFNEPYDYWIADGTGKWECWMSGCARNQIAYEPYDWRSTGMQQIVTAIRSAGAQQPVIVNGTDWANDLTEWTAPSDPAGQIVVGQHVYKGQPGSSLTALNTYTAGLAARYPVVIGETGDSAAGPADWLPTLLPWADSHGVSYLAWTWNPWGNERDVLIKDWTGTPTDGEGVAFRNHLLSAG